MAIIGRISKLVIIIPKIFRKVLTIFHWQCANKEPPISEFWPDEHAMRMRCFAINGSLIRLNTFLVLSLYSDNKWMAEWMV